MSSLNTTGVSMSKLLIFFFVSLWLSALPIQAFSLEPGLIELSMSPGQSETHSLKIENSAPNPIKLNLTTANLKFVGDGSLRFVTSVTAPANWLTLSAKTISVPAYSKMDVAWTLTIPTDTQLASAYGSILVYQQTEDENSQVAVAKQLASLIFVDITNNSRRGMSILKFSHSQDQFAIEVSNSGNTYIRPHGRVEIDSEQIIVNKDLAYILPDDKKIFKIPWTKWGWHTAKLTIEADGANPVYESITFAIIPWKEIMVLCLLLGFLLTIYYRLKKSKR